MIMAAGSAIPGPDHPGLGHPGLGQPGLGHPGLDIPRMDYLGLSVPYSHLNVRVARAIAARAQTASVTVFPAGKVAPC